MAGRKEESVGFGAFEVDFDLRELRREGVRVKLQDQPFSVLAILLERPGEIITRDEFRQRIWGVETFVDFDQGLNKAVRQIRSALCDSAEQPIFIETLPKRGYRFIAPLSTSGPVEIVTPPAAPPSRKWPWGVAAVAALLALATVLFFFVRHYGKPEREIRLRQLTTNSPENSLTGVRLSPDGRSFLYGDQLGIHLRIIATGETHHFERPPSLSDRDAWSPIAWFPDQTHFLAESETLTSTGVVPACWRVSLLGDGATKLRERADAAGVSPDGSHIAFTTGGPNNDLEMWLMGSNGENARFLTRREDHATFCCMQWSPDGRRLFNMKARFYDHTDLIESRDPRGGAATTLVTHVVAAEDQWPTITGYVIFADGRVMYAQRGSDPSPGGSTDANLWERKVDLNSGKPEGEPRRLTHWFGNDAFGGFSLSRDERTLLLHKARARSQAYIGEMEERGPLGQLRPVTQEESDNLPYAWTPDSKAVFLLSDRTGTWRLYKQFIDQPLAEMVNTDPASIGQVRVSPDGQWLFYSTESDKKDYARLMTQPLAGGTPRLLREVKGVTEIGCPLATPTSCAFAQDEGAQQVLSSIDLTTGRARRLFSVASRNGASGLLLSGRIALTQDSNSGETIQLLSASGEVEHALKLPRWLSLNSFDGSSDPDVFYTSSIGPKDTTILRVHLSGKVEPLWFMKGSQAGWATPSPDGRHLAVLGSSTDSNAWLVENF